MNKKYLFILAGAISMNLMPDAMASTLFDYNNLETSAIGATEYVLSSSNIIEKQMSIDSTLFNDEIFKYKK